MRWKRAKLFCVKVIIGISLCVYFFFLMLPVVMPRKYDGNGTNSYLFTRLSHQSFKYNLAEDYDAEFTIFTTRVAAQMLTGIVWDTPCDPHFWNGYRFGALSITFGRYQTFWLALLFGLLIYHRRDAVLLMLGIFAGLMYNLTQVAGCWWCPWDMPSMCLFTWAILVFLKSEYFPLLLVVFTASLFKETGLVCALLILFGPWSWKKRIFGFVGLVIAFFVCRKFLMYASGATAILLPFNEATDTLTFIQKAIVHFRDNLGILFSFHLNSPFFANCGLLFVMFLLPARKAVKLTAAAFLAGQFLFGCLIEFRVYFELLPLGMMQLSEYLQTAKENE
jgi:hypothetical protein